MHGDGRGAPLADDAEGSFLHPSLGENIDEAVIAPGRRIRFTTIDRTA